MTSNDVSATKELAHAALSGAFDGLVELSHRLHAHPETGLLEVKASQWVAEEAAEVPGARVTIGLGSLPTAVRAEVGSGELVIVICAEYDALPDLGHACGHNIIAAAAVGAFQALAPLAEQLELTIRLLGTPAEETVGGKVTMLEQGDFDGAHAAMMVHPSDRDQVAVQPYACVGLTARYTGREAHASAGPWDGVNAQDALVVAMAAIGLARQQLRPHQQIHGFTRGAGIASNVIPAFAEAEFMIRADSLESLEEVEKVLRRCLEAGALASGAELEAEHLGAIYANLNSDPVMQELFAANAASLGRQLSTSATPGGSTDMGNVSIRLPSIHPMLALGPESPPIHHTDFAARAVSADGDRAVWDGALTMAYTCIDLALDKVQRARLLKG